MERRYLTDPYCGEIETTAEHTLTRDGELWLAPSVLIFHPEGGGQPNDRAELLVQGKNVPIEGVGRQDGRVYLRVRPDEDDLSELSWLYGSGEPFTYKIDLDYRLKAMRRHTAAHVLMACLRRNLSDYVPKGMTIPEDLGAVQLRFLGKEDVETLAEKVNGDANALIASGCEVKPESYASIELAKAARPDLFRADEGLPFRKAVRMLFIDGVDFNPCGGTHVKDISEIGSVKIGKCGRIEESLQTIEFFVPDLAAV